MSNIDKVNVNGTEYGIEGVAGDSKNDTTTFTSSDVADGSASTWTSVNVLASGEKHSSIFAKVSQMFKNVRYLYKTLTALNTNKLQIVECSTARSTAAKEVTLANFTLETGAHIFVRFTDTGSSNPSSGNLTLNVNNTDAKTIVDGHTNKTVMTYSNAGYFYNNYVAEFVYDGTYWVWLNRDTNTTYNGSSLKTSSTKTGSGTAYNNTISSNTSMDNAIGILLNNDATLSNEINTGTTSIHVTTSYNSTGSTIAKGTYFYLNGTLVCALVNIANGADFTLNTNYKVVTAGGLNELNNEISDLKSALTKHTLGSPRAITSTAWTATSDGYVVANVSYLVGRFIYININDIPMIRLTTVSDRYTSVMTGYQSASVFVREGMSIKIANQSSHGDETAYFYPLT